jgi:Fe-Mn family superoxide dismutase
MSPSDSTPWSRRDALKALGAGAALVGLAAVAGRTLAAGGANSATPPAASTAPGTRPFTLPPLGFAYDALEPHIDARTMEIHYTKHHQAYIDNANQALANQPGLRELSGESLLQNLAGVPEGIRTAVRNQVGGHVNHSLFWKLIAPGGASAPTGGLAQALNARGGLDKFKAEFASAALGRFGSGWAWLSWKDGRLVVHSTANQDSPLSESARPVLGLDVWEHAYYLHYQNRRADYVAAFWNVVNWSQVEANYAAALAV